MKVEARTMTVATNVTLLESEAEILKKAQMLIDTIFSALVDADEISGDSNAERVYKAIVAIEDYLDIIRESAIIEED